MIALSRFNFPLGKTCLSKGNWRPKVEMEHNNLTVQPRMQLLFTKVICFILLFSSTLKTGPRIFPFNSVRLACIFHSNPFSSASVGFNYCRTYWPLLLKQLFCSWTLHWCVFSYFCFQYITFFFFFFTYLCKCIGLNEFRLNGVIHNWS